MSSVLNHPIMAGSIVAGLTVVIGYVLYRVVPMCYEKLKSIYNRHYYKTVIFTIGQNKNALVNVIKFMSGHLQDDSFGVNSRINIDGLEYNVQVDKHIYFEDPNSTFFYYVKFSVDNTGNVANVMLSSYKRDKSCGIDMNRIRTFERFIATVSPSNVAITTAATVTAVRAVTQNLAKPTGSYQMSSNETASLLANVASTGGTIQDKSSIPLDFV